MAEGDLAARAGSHRGGRVRRARACARPTGARPVETLGELRTERDLLVGILAGMQEGVLLLDRKVKWRSPIPALREMLLLGATPSANHRSRVMRHAELKELIRPGEEVGRARIASRSTSRGLKPRRLLVRAAPLDGEQGGLFAVFVDVTEMRRLESLRRDFVANVSHELRTPVTAIRSAAETLESAVEPRSRAATVNSSTSSNATRSGCSSLVEDLLDLSRIESRELRLELEPSLGAQPSTTTCRACSASAPTRSACSSCSTCPTICPPVRADRRALEHVLTNLVDNAVKYCGPASTVELGASRGVGEGSRSSSSIPVRESKQRHLPRLFERFYRVDAGRSRELGGTGLGLSIVKHLVEAMSGNVGVERTPGAGTTFNVSLRRAERNPAATSRPPPAAGAA